MYEGPVMFAALIMINFFFFFPQGFCSFLLKRQMNSGRLCSERAYHPSTALFIMEVGKCAMNGVQNCKGEKWWLCSLCSLVLPCRRGFLSLHHLPTHFYMILGKSLKLFFSQVIINYVFLILWEPSLRHLGPALQKCLYVQGILMNT